MERSCEGRGGCWHQKWLGLLRTTCPDMRQREPRPREGPLAAGPVSWGCRPCPYANPRAKAARRPPPLSSIHLHTSCDGVLTASWADHPVAQLCGRGEGGQLSNSCVSRSFGLSARYQGCY